MKKVIRARTQDASPAEEVESPAQTPDPEPESKWDVQAPPLPTYPPPAESPPVRVKQERADEEPSPPPPAAATTTHEPPDMELCKDFVKGQCARPVCRHSHDVQRHLAQLPRLFESCWTFQNTNSCPHSKCRFMHVSIFEQRKFYRTGELPPHAYAHQLQSAPSAGTQPPPPATPQRAPAPSSDAPQPHHNGTDAPRRGGIQCIPASSLAALEAAAGGGGGADDLPPATACMKRADCAHCHALKAEEQYLRVLVSSKRAQAQVDRAKLEEQERRNMEQLKVIMAVKQLMARGGDLQQLKTFILSQRRGGGGRAGRGLAPLQ